MQNCPLGYYASYIIGAEWTKDYSHSFVVTPKKGAENIDFVSMFYYCFSSGLDSKAFSKIYTINIGAPPIKVNGTSFPIGLLTIVHFLSVVNRIRCLKSGYKTKTDNLRKIRGHVDILKNDKVNISQHKYDYIYCHFNEYDVDIPENRIIKKALMFAQKYLKQTHFSGGNLDKIKTLFAKCNTKFINVSPNVKVDQIKETRYHKLFKDYGEALRLAKMILKQYDYNIKKVSNDNDSVIPFTIDMSLLYEHYVYGLLNEAYKGRVKYQFKSETGYPDFLYYSSNYKAILDTKYIPRFEEDKIDKYIIRQLSGYGRDKLILNELGFKDFKKAPTIPCIILYPSEKSGTSNPFKSDLELIEKVEVDGIIEFYKIAVPVPIIQ